MWSFLAKILEGEQMFFLKPKKSGVSGGMEDGFFPSKKMGVR